MALRTASLGLDPRHTSAASSSRAGSRPGSVCVNDAQVNYAALELPMGGWKESGLGSRHGADGIRKYTKRQSLLVTPGYAPSREPTFPLHRRGRAGRWRGVRGAGHQRPLRRRPAGDAAALCDTFIPSLEPPEGGPIRTASGPARRRTSRPRGRSRSRCCRPGFPRSSSTGLRGLLDALAASGMAAATPQEAARGRSCSASGRPGGAGRDRRPARHRGDPLLRAARPRHRHQPELAAIGYPGPICAAAGSSTGRSRCTAPRRRGDHRGRRLHRRLRRRRRRDRRRAGRGGQVGLRARDGRLPRRPRLRRARALRLSAPVPQRGPFPTAEGQVAILAGPASAAARSSTGPTACGPRLGARGVGPRAWARGARRARLRRPHGRGLGAAAGQRRLLRPVRPASPAPGGLRGARLRLPDDHPQHRPATYDPASAAFMGFGDQSGSKHSTAKTYLPTPSGRARGSSPTAGPSASWSRTAAPPGSRPPTPIRSRERRREHPRRRPRAGRRRRLRLARVARRCCCARGSAAPRPATTSACTRPPRSRPSTPSRRTGGWGPPQAALSHEFADLGDGYGFLFEAAQSTTGLTAGAMPWRSGAEHKEIMSAGTTPRR